MAEHHIVCGGLRSRSGKPSALHIDVDAPVGSPNRVNLRIDQISARLAANIPDVLTDMLEVSAYVYCADQFTSRGTTQMTAMGADWRRRFHFKIPVRRLDVWIRPEVGEALRESLGFLSEDEYDFEFVQSTKPLPVQSYLQFDDPDGQSFSPDEIILFSGGLDSLAGTVQALMGDGRRVALVSHQSSNMIISKQNGLIARLRERSKAGSLFFIPVRINKGNEEAAEFTQRTRSFMFASLALVVARMFDCKDLSFYENGVVSINLPIAEHVLGARASRTTHPRFLANCGQLFSLLLSGPFTLKNPFLWKTKSEVVRVLEHNHVPDLISHSFSCTRVREATRVGQHCGVCSQCVDRRFGILAARLSAHDPSENYAVDLFTGAHETGSALTMTEGFVLRGQKLATMSEQAFVSTYGQVFRAVEHLPGSADENVAKLWDLHRRHGVEVVTVVDQEIQSRGSLAQALNMPANCLLAMVLSPTANQPRYIDPTETEATASEQALADVHEYKWEELVFAIDAPARRVVFNGGLEIGGSVYELIEALAEKFVADLEAGTFPQHHSFLKASALAKRLNIDEASLRQRVSRSRKTLTKAFSEKMNRQLVTDEIIENQEWKGYRLNPYLLMLNVSQLRRRYSSLSQVGRAPVTTRGVER